MKFIEARTVTMKSDVELGDKKDSFNLHVKTTIKLPDADNDQTRKIVELLRNTHKEIDDINQTQLPLDNK